MVQRPFWAGDCATTNSRTAGTSSGPPCAASRRIRSGGRSSDPSGMILMAYRIIHKELNGGGTLLFALPNLTTSTGFETRRWVFTVTAGLKTPQARAYPVCLMGQIGPRKGRVDRLSQRASRGIALCSPCRGRLSPLAYVWQPRWSPLPRPSLARRNQYRHYGTTRWCVTT